MAYSSFANGFKIQTKSAIDQRIILTKAEMLDISRGKKYLVPDLYFAFCTDDNKMYLFNRKDTEHPFDAETGYYHLLEDYLTFDASESSKENIEAAIKDSATVNAIETVLQDTVSEEGTVEPGLITKVEQLEQSISTIDGGEIA